MTPNTSQIKSQTGTVSLFRVPYNLIRPVYEKSAFHRSVIDELKDSNLRDAYAHCRALTRYHAKTFYLSTRFLPNEKQRSIFSIYSLCRYMDDLIDESFDLNKNRSIQEKDLSTIILTFKTKLNVAYDSGIGDSPILTAFADTLKNYHIPKEYPLELLEGVCMDLNKNRYETFEELYTYSYKVASIVGLMTSEVFGYDDVDAKKHAIDLGIAMQLTNILRDVGEDLHRNRIYLPKEDLERFKISENDLFENTLDDRFTALMQFQIERARGYYDSADKGIPLLEADSRLPVYLARHNYSRILDRIEDNKYQVFTQRAHLSTSEKLAIIPKAWLSAMM
jgi:phytoene synthase